MVSGNYCRAVQCIYNYMLYNSVCDYFSSTLRFCEFNLYPHPNKVSETTNESVLLKKDRFPNGGINIYIKSTDLCQFV